MLRDVGSDNFPHCLGIFRVVDKKFSLHYILDLFQWVSKYPFDAGKKVSKNF
jgi:hypothetical protein